MQFSYIISPYTISLVVLSSILQALDYPLGQVFYLTAATGILLAIFWDLIRRGSILDRWWRLIPLTGLFIAGLIYDHTQNLMIAVVILIIACGLAFYIEIRPEDVDEVS